MIATELTRSLPFLAFLASFASPFVAKSWTEGAQPALYLATDPGAKPVAWHHDVSEAQGAVEIGDDALAQELWVKSLTALKMKDPFE